MSKFYPPSGPPKKHLVRCSCGVRYKSDGTTPCPSAKWHGFDDPWWNKGPADSDRFFDQRLYDRRGRERSGWLERAVERGGSRRTGLTLAGRGLQTVLREEREAQARLAERKQRRLAWRETEPHLTDATPKQREAYRLHVEGGQSYKDVANTLGGSLRSARDLIEKARAHEERSKRKAIISAR
jgi:Sigma-70, region 4